MEPCSGRYDLRSKRIAVLGGNNIMEEVNQAAEKFGFSFVTFAKSPNSPAHRFSHEICYVDPGDPDVMLPLLKEKKIDGVLSFSGERLLRRTIKWIGRTGYPYYSTEKQWDILMNKKRFREYAAKFDIPVVPEYQVDRGTGLPSESANLPIVVKPADNSGSVGVTICRTREELAEAYASAMDKSECGDVLFERFLDGRYFQFEIWLQDGKAYFPYCKERIFYPQVGHTPPQPFLDIYPSDDANTIASALHEKVKVLMLSLGIRDGSCMFQGFVVDGTPYIMDVAFRLSGGMDHRIVQKEKGVNLVESHILYALTRKFGGNFKELSKPYRHVYATLCVGLRNGTIASVSELDAISRLQSVFGLFEHWRVGDIIRSSGTFSQTYLRIFLSADERRQIKNDLDEVLGLIQVYNEKGESMLLDFPEYKKI